MSKKAEGSDCAYIAYIDESGDDGIKSVWPIDKNGSSEWFVLGAAIIRSDKEKQTINAVRDIRAKLTHTQRPDIHFTNLSEHHKRLVCREMARLEARYIAIVSNKKNMRQYRNKRAEKVLSRNPFYCWMCRLLLERITTFCRARCEVDFNGQPRPVRLEFSHRGGMSYGQLRAYLALLHMQEMAGTMYLTRGSIEWSVVDINQVFSFSHKTRAGLQLADCVASAFHTAVNVRRKMTCNPEFAELLKPRIWAPGKQALDKGFKFMPPNLRDANLREDQRSLFEIYGYNSEGW